ncbi:hypothetical protein MC28_A07 (plasmid) [Bacillus thuringiensis MC28]|nr:hypothetical protein MC28_A01 [Bacillus thuringiensis MC28]AFU16873.1 hypothetical protein MC28_A07 [Bacillus thuringiensis MC28]
MNSSHSILLLTLVYLNKLYYTCLGFFIFCLNFNKYRVYFL